MKVEEIDQREALFNGYLDGELSDEEREEFQRRLDEEPELRAAYEEFAGFVGKLRDLPRATPTEDFADGVRNEIRSRSHGQFFTNNLTYRRRAPHEKIAAAMLVIMTSAYAYLGLSMDRHIESPTHPPLEVPPQSINE